RGLPALRALLPDCALRGRGALAAGDVLRLPPQRATEPRHVPELGGDRRAPDRRGRVHDRARVDARLAGDRGGGDAPAGATLTGTRFRIDAPTSGSTNVSSVIALTLGPSTAPATRRLDAAEACPKPWGSETTPGMMSAVTATRANSSPARLFTRTRSPP